MKLTIGKPIIDMQSMGDVWDSSWAEDDNLYLVSDDTQGFNNQPGRNLSIHVMRGETVEKLVGETINLMDEYGTMTQKSPDGTMWKANGISCENGVLYVFVSKHGLNFNTRQTAVDSSLICSTDKGKTWKRTAKENYDKPMFPGARFGSPFFIKYGKNGAANVHNADKYVYAVSNNGFWENGDNVILGRVLKSKIADLNATDWQFFSGSDGLSDKDWSPDMNQAKLIITNEGKCGMTGAQYNAPLKKYFMVQWYYNLGSAHIEANAHETTFNYLESSTPWGPWSVIGSDKFNPQGYYNPCIVPKFISADGKQFWIVTNGNFFTAFKSGTECLYRFTLLPATVSIDQPVKK
jgi:hypothetical protein